MKPRRIPRLQTLRKRRSGGVEPVPRHQKPVLKYLILGNKCDCTVLDTMYLYFEIFTFEERFSIFQELQDSEEENIC
jgi:hypothetical protein